MTDRPSPYAGCRLEMCDCENTLLREIADRRLHRKTIALSYALSLMSSERNRVDWAKVNKAIVERWSPSALEWIKREAWKRVK